MSCVSIIHSILHVLWLNFRHSCHLPHSGTLAAQECRSRVPGSISSGLTPSLREDWSCKRVLETPCHAWIATSPQDPTAMSPDHWSKLTWDTVSAGGYDLFGPIGYLDRIRDRACKQRVIVTPATDSWYVWFYVALSAHHLVINLNNLHIDQWPLLQWYNGTRDNQCVCQCQCQDLKKMNYYFYECKESAFGWHLVMLRDINWVCSLCMLCAVWFCRSVQVIT